MVCCHRLYMLGALMMLTMAGNGVQGATKKLHGINYNARQGPDWSPVDQRCKSSQQVQQDLQTLQSITDSIRIFSLTDCDESALVLPTAIDLGLKVSIGLWISNNATVFLQEQTRFNQLVQAHPRWFTDGNIVEIHVGSEAIYRGDVSVSENIAHLKTIKAICVAHGISTPVSIAEIGGNYFNNPQLFDAVDVVSANIFPFWQKMNVTDGAKYFQGFMKSLTTMASAKGKKVIIGETGWATGGVSENSSPATPANAAAFLAAFYKLAVAESWEYFYFEGFDETWKLDALQAPTNVEGFWGIFDVERAMKPEFVDFFFGVGEENETTPSASRSGDATATTIRPRHSNVTNLNETSNGHIVESATVPPSWNSNATTGSSSSRIGSNTDAGSSRSTMPSGTTTSTSTVVNPITTGTTSKFTPSTDTIASKPGVARSSSPTSGTQESIGTSTLPNIVEGAPGTISNRPRSNPKTAPTLNPTANPSSTKTNSNQVVLPGSPRDNRC